jgi:16S rRNA (uracil1498-N3)-methyltransferase
VSVWIGPEGGWDEREWKSAHERGVRLISLGERTLRADAVPVAIISILSFLWEH